MQCLAVRRWLLWIEGAGICNDLAPTAKLPCSWITSGSNLLLLVSCALAEVKSKTAINEAAMKVFRYFLFILHSPAMLRIT